ncbi:MAG: AAA family ATPase [Candidatus Micrarchaeota archaeon]
MENQDFEKLLRNSESLKKWGNSFTKKRHLFEKAMGITDDYFVGIVGLRGIGKTILLLQIAGRFENSIYFSADAIFLRKYSIYEIAEHLQRQGFQNIFIDEIHTSYEWAGDLKAIYDEKRARVFFSGSSGLKIRGRGADLSRRAVILELKPASYREYLNIKKGYDIPPYDFKTIMESRKDLSIRHAEASRYLEDYMLNGGVLFGGSGFREALGNTLDKMLTKDLISMRGINSKYENDAYKLLYHVASSPPYEFSYNSVSQKLGIGKTFLITLISNLEDAGIIKTLLPCQHGLANVKKEPKVFLSPPYRFLLCPNPDKGALREEFFVNNADPDCYFKTKRGEKTPDFLKEGKVVEVGGVSKKSYAMADLIAVDGVKFEGKFMPLFLFGLLY